ncbi:hypothetical protein FG379_003595 [Cryptosporidium bovis]|uniref:uncharacterized protein n=1 Tax=Cryptosporidium bovis TaxID=310047 RepID=UPI003519FFCC|nr:hypothetical protein FG379_003595 [Cryptosporidium bovis]
MNNNNSTNNKKKINYNSNLVNNELFNSIDGSNINNGLMLENKYKKSPIIHKNQNSGLLNIKIESPGDEELIEELLIDLSLLLTKLRNNLDGYEFFSKERYDKRNKIVDLISVCISVGLRITYIIEEKYNILENRCNIINESSICCNWFTYWNENFPRGSLIENDIQEFDSIKKRNELLVSNGNKFNEEHKCTISCVKYGKSISDFKMLCKIANSLFYKAFMMNLRFSKEYSDELDQIDVDEGKISGSINNQFVNLNRAECEDLSNNKHENNNSYHLKVDYSNISYDRDNEGICWNNNEQINIDDKSLYRDNKTKINKKNMSREFLFDVKKKNNECLNESSGSSKMTSFEDLLLPEILCTTVDEIELSDNKGKNNDIYLDKEINMCLRNSSRRTSIIIENIDYESLVEFNNNISKLKKSILKVKEVQKEVNRLIIESTGDIDCLEGQTELTQLNTAQGLCCVAEGCKLKSSWWPFQGSTAGLVCGSAAGLLLGPVGISVGAAVGGAIGLTFGKMLKASCEARMDEILKECEERKSRKNQSIVNNKNSEYELLVEVFDDNLNDNNNILLSDDYYNKYISNVTLSDILENVDVIP